MLREACGSRDLSGHVRYLAAPAAGSPVNQKEHEMKKATHGAAYKPATIVDARGVRRRRAPADPDILKNFVGTTGKKVV